MNVPVRRAVLQSQRHIRKEQRCVPLRFGPRAHEMVTPLSMTPTDLAPRGGRSHLAWPQSKSIGIEHFSNMFHLAMGCGS